MSFHPYEIPFMSDQERSGILVQITDKIGSNGWGDIAPLPKWSKETLDEAFCQLNKKKNEIHAVDWTATNCLKELAKLALLPSVSFGLESALLSILAPIQACTVAASALLMGSVKEILEQAQCRKAEGFISAKLKVSNLRFEEAYQVIKELKDKFRLRVDVNRAWDTEESIRFFSQFAKDAFDYVEEPFKNPYDLIKFEHPLAIDESYPENLSLAQMSKLPNLKALIYKPTIQGGVLGCLPLHEWTSERGIDLVLSSSFESDIGLACVALIAHRLSLLSPVGIGTYHFMKEHLSPEPLRFSGGKVHIPSVIPSGVTR